MRPGRPARCEGIDSDVYTTVVGAHDTVVGRVVDTSLAAAVLLTLLWETIG